MDAMRPRGIGDFGISEVKMPEPVPVDGDDYTWDWHAAQSGDLGPVDLTPTGTMTGGAVQGLRYDVRTGPERVSWQVATALYAMERQLALLQQRVAALERGARGEGRETT